MHRVWKHLCLARRRDAWYAHGRQRDSSPAGADVLAPTCVGVFFMAGYTGHKKDPISFEAGLAPSCSRMALYPPLPCRIFSMGETKLFCPVAPAIKKTRSHSRRASPPRAPPRRYIIFASITTVAQTAKRALCRGRVLFVWVVLFWLVGAESGSLLRLGLRCERLGCPR